MKKILLYGLMLVPGAQLFCAAASKKSKSVKTYAKKLYPCDFFGCEYVVAKKDHLVDHRRTHTDEKPFQCNFSGCKYAAAQKGNLARHRRTHTGERPFPCDFPGCEHAATRKDDLARHKKRHLAKSSSRAIKRKLPASALAMAQDAKRYQADHYDLLALIAGSAMRGSELRDVLIAQQNELSADEIERDVFDESCFDANIDSFAVTQDASLFDPQGDPSGRISEVDPCGEHSVDENAQRQAAVENDPLWAWVDEE